MKNILVGIDFTEADVKVLAQAKELALAFDCSLHLIHMSPPEPVFVGYPDFIYPGFEDSRTDVLQEEKAKLSTLVDDLEKEGVKAKAFMREASASAGLLEFAETHDEGMLVVGTHSRNLIERALLGRTADRVIRKSKIPVMIVPTPNH